MQPGGIGDCLIRRFLVVLDIETITDPREGPQEARDQGQLDANATPWEYTWDTAQNISKYHEMIHEMIQLVNVQLVFCAFRDFSSTARGQDHATGGHTEALEGTWPLGDRTFGLKPSGLNHLVCDQIWSVYGQHRFSCCLSSEVFSLNFSLDIPG